MNWFQRHGIAGTYFLLLVMAWSDAFYHVPYSAGESRDLGTLLAGAFLPAGYLVTTLSQLLYLDRPQRAKFIRWMQWLIHPQSDGGGVMRRAAELARIRFVNALHSGGLVSDETTAETTLEADSVTRLLLPGLTGPTEQSLRDWIARRTDVMAINTSLTLATALAPFAAAVVLLWISRGQASSLAPNLRQVILVVVLSLGSLALGAALRHSTRLMFDEVVQVVAAIFHKAAVRQGNSQLIVLVGARDLANHGIE